MRSFFKIFLASFLALVVFVVIFFFFLAGYVSSIASNPVRGHRFQCRAVVGSE